MCAQPPVGLPDATGTASVTGPLAWHHPPWPWGPHQPRPHPSAQARRLRRSRASCQGVTVSACRALWPTPPLPPRCPIPVDTSHHHRAPTALGFPEPFRLLPLMCPQEQGAGGLGGPGPAAVGAAGGACAAGPEPVTGHHLKGWGISVRGPRPREKPARLSRAQVPARGGRVGEQKRSCSQEAALGGGTGGPTCSQPSVSLLVTDCTAIEGAQYSPCGPPCPRSCDDLVVSLDSPDTPSWPLTKGHLVKRLSVALGSWPLTWCCVASSGGDG